MLRAARPNKLRHARAYPDVLGKALNRLASPLWALVIAPLFDDLDAIDAIDHRPGPAENNKIHTADRRSKFDQPILGEYDPLAKVVEHSAVRNSFLLASLLTERDRPNRTYCCHGFEAEFHDPRPRVPALQRAR